MLILSDLRGQLCNRIFLTSYGVALGALTGQTLVDFSLDKYARLFPRTRRPGWAEIPYRIARYAARVVVVAAWASRVGRFLIVDVTWENTAEISPGNPAFIARLRRRPLTFLRVDQYFDLSRLRFPDIESMRRHFEPDAELVCATNEYVQGARGDAEVLVGLHMRRRDYEAHLGGRHFYPLEFYAQALERMTTLLSARRVAFLVCSDEPVPENFGAPHRVTPGPGTLLGDLYGLAACDYVLGPPSTFSLWAAYYGRKPIFQMIRPELPSRLNQFMVPDGHFEGYDLNTV